MNVKINTLIYYIGYLLNHFHLIFFLYIAIINFFAHHLIDCCQTILYSFRLQIAKESIFTGLNNFTVRSITSQYGGEYFGFTQNEINETLNYYNLNDKKEEMKEWYDGYLFGEKEIYNPWSSMNYILELLGNIEYPAISFWANTSGNDIVRQCISFYSLILIKPFHKYIVINCFHFFIWYDQLISICYLFCLEKEKSIIHGVQ